MEALGCLVSQDRAFPKAGAWLSHRPGVLQGHTCLPPSWHKLCGEFLWGLSGKQASKAPNKQPYIWLILSYASQNNLFPCSLGNHVQDAALWQGRPNCCLVLHNSNIYYTFIILFLRMNLRLFFGKTNWFVLEPALDSVDSILHPGNGGGSSP